MGGPRESGGPSLETAAGRGMPHTMQIKHSVLETESENCAPPRKPAAAVAAAVAAVVAAVAAAVAVYRMPSGMLAEGVGTVGCVIVAVFAAVFAAAAAAVAVAVAFAAAGGARVQR